MTLSDLQAKVSASRGVADFNGDVRASILTLPECYHHWLRCTIASEINATPPATRKRTRTPMGRIGSRFAPRDAGRDRPVYFGWSRAQEQACTAATQ